MNASQESALGTGSHTDGCRVVSYQNSSPAVASLSPSQAGLRTQQLGDVQLGGLTPSLPTEASQYPLPMALSSVGPLAAATETFHLLAYQEDQSQGWHLSLCV